MKKILTILAILMVAMTIQANEVTYTDVSTAEGLSTAINANANIKLTADIDVSSLSATTGGYLFGTFTGKITGENASDTDYTITGGSKPMFYNVVGAEISHVIFSSFKVSNVTSALARTSSGSTFSHVTMTGCTLSNSDDDTYNTGLISGYSDSDTFEYCIVDATCSIKGENKNTGGLVGRGNANDTFRYCYNAATVNVDNNNVGGIVGFINTNTNVERCLNMGTVKAVSSYGGIVGNSTSSTISQCVNTGSFGQLSGADSSLNTGGIVGKTNKCSISYCLNFGNLPSYEEGKYDPIAGDSDHSTYSNNLWYCTVYGEHEDNLSEFSTTYAAITSGEFAHSKTNASGETYLYQDIDGNDFSTFYPVPIPAAGTVYSNILCDGTLSYCNDYNSTAAHTFTDDGNGYCSVCGTLYGTGDITSTVHVTNATILNNVAGYVNAGKDFSKVTIYLDNDIDFGGVDFTPIGKSSSTPFRGTFDGQGHRIKNLTINCAQGEVGLFGVVSGTSTIIRNVVIDSSCSITSTSGAGVAGLVGSVKPYSGTAATVKIFSCGNEATITGYQNAAGILGGVYENDNNNVTIVGCYNSGAIKGTKESAAICGYIRKNYELRVCYNTGTVTGYDSGSPFYRRATGGTSNLLYNFDVNDNSQYIDKITAQDVALGNLCIRFNERLEDIPKYQTFPHMAQDLGKDSHPTFGTTDITYSRSMTNQWGTICLPVNVIFSENEPYDFYKISSITADAITLTKMTGVLPYGTPALIRISDTAKDAETGKYKLLLRGNGDVNTTITNPDPVGGLTLTGTFTNKEITSEDGYIIANNAFWNISTLASSSSSKIYCSPFRAYLAGTVNNARCLSIGETTGINEVLNGANGAKGLNGKFIINGRVVIIRNGVEYDVNGQELK